eukprot:8308304-Pyramimonas_sp.AAC.1
MAAYHRAGKQLCREAAAQSAVRAVQAKVHAAKNRRSCAPRTQYHFTELRNHTATYIEAKRNRQNSMPRAVESGRPEGIARGVLAQKRSSHCGINACFPGGPGRNSLPTEHLGRHISSGARNAHARCALPTRPVDTFQNGRGRAQPQPSDTFHHVHKCVQPQPKPKL